MQDRFYITCLTIFFLYFIGDLAADKRFCSVCALRTIICNIYHGMKGKSCALYDRPFTTAQPIADKIQELSPSFTIGHQEDPSEFLIFLMDHLAICLTSAEPFKNTESMVTPIHRIFGFEIKSTLRCEICFNTSSTIESTNVLIIPIDSQTTITQGLRTYFSDERLDSANLYSCTICQKQVPSIKTLKLIKAPPVIFILLKRFEYNVMLNISRKVHRFITYPEILDLKSYFDENVLNSNKENDTINNYLYKLNGIVVHRGESASVGHIFSYIRSPDSTWYKADDEHISSVKLDTVLGDKDAYILCYVKITNTGIIPIDKEVVISPLRSSSRVISSTPIHPSKLYNEKSSSNSIVRNNLSILFLIPFYFLYRHIIQKTFIFLLLFVSNNAKQIIMFHHQLKFHQL